MKKIKFILWFYRDVQSSHGIVGELLKFCSLQDHAELSSIMKSLVPRNCQIFASQKSPAPISILNGPKKKF